MKRPISTTGKILAGLAAGVVIFGIGTGVGVAGSGGTAVSEPRVVTKEVEVPGPVRTKEVEVVKEVKVPGPVRTKEVKVKVEVTPQACIEALDLAGQGLALASTQADIAGSAIMATAEGDIATLESLTLDMEALNAELDALAGPLGTASQECRAK